MPLPVYHGQAIDALGILLVYPIFPIQNQQLMVHGASIRGIPRQRFTTRPNNTRKNPAPS